ncbi:hypothetical protein RFI_13812 [Reticulomyxa filosa]|uniref:Uncharacterized protein n=1 Tax=Reticulomyxa filosa TaxID=46433 RepID=X6NBY2_RETFI|nr:hypothetical protein RFI_13812 [Reticulomyxa filosa]|eukprot:ETO23368.1 hypothetical protein RFI_13812 [Reticulomyxa filosa]
MFFEFIKFLLFVNSRENLNNNRPLLVGVLLFFFKKKNEIMADSDSKPQLPELLKPKLPQIKFLPSRTAKSLGQAREDGTLKERVIKNTIEFTQNPLTGLFLVRAKKLWDSFPGTMQFVWIAAVLASSAVQWAACLALFFYFLGITVTNQTDVNSSEPAGVQLISTLLAATILFIYLLGEIRSAFRTFQGFFLYLNYSFLNIAPERDIFFF